MLEMRHLYLFMSVASNVILVKSKVSLSSGENTLELWHVDPGVAVEKIILFREGAEDKSYLGWKSTWVE